MLHFQAAFFPGNFAAENEAAAFFQSVLQIRGIEPCHGKAAGGICNGDGDYLEIADFVHIHACGDGGADGCNRVLLQRADFFRFLICIVNSRSCFATVFTS